MRMHVKRAICSDLVELGKAFLQRIHDCHHRSYADSFNCIAGWLQKRHRWPIADLPQPSEIGSVFRCRVCFSKQTGDGV
jgi:hypothetical protein